MKNSVYETQVRSSQLDVDYNAARWCSDEAASERIFGAANTQDHLAEAYLSILFDKGCKAFPVDRSTAILYASRATPWLTSKANRGDPYIEFVLGSCLCDGRGITKNETEAARCYQRAADQGHAGAQYNLGICYIYGIGVSRNEETAARFYHLAAEQGHAAAQNNLGHCYEVGNGVQLRDSRSFSQYGHQPSEAPSMLSYLFCCAASSYRTTSLDEESTRYYQLDSDEKLSTPTLDSGNSSDCGNGIGIPANPIEAARYYTLAADQGHAAALYNLGRCYLNGLGVAKNTTEGMKYCRMAADRGLAEAQHLIGYNLVYGIHIYKSESDGLMYLQLACEQGHAGARAALEKIETNKNGWLGWMY